MSIRSKVASAGMKFFVAFAFVILALSSAGVFAGPSLSASSAGMAVSTMSKQVPFGGEKSLVNGLEAYYKLDDAQNGVAVNEVGPDAVNLGATTGVGGVIGTAYEFNYAPNEYVDTLTDIVEETSISFWMDPDSNSYVFGTIGPNSGRDGYQAYYYNGHLEIYYISNDQGVGIISVDVSSQVSQGWVHIVFTVDQDNDAKIYVNGIEAPTIWDIWDTVPSVHDRPLMIGAEREGTYRGFDGKLDEFAVWDRALSSTEVLALWNNGNGLSY